MTATRGALLAAGAITVLAVASAAAVHVARQPDDQIGMLVSEVVEAGAPGVIVLIRDGDDVRTTAAGLAGHDSRRQLYGGERFRIGSVTKTFVAVVVLQLVAEERLDLDDTVERSLPGVVRGGERITIRQLLGHRSGLFDYVDDPRVFAPYAHRPRHLWEPMELIELALSHPPLFSPGQRYGYSSTNYLLLQLVVERASGRPLSAVLRERIFVPVGLASTTFEPALVSGAYMHGHRPPSHQGVVTGPPRDTSREAASWTWGAAAIVSTARDLDRFFVALLGGSLLPPRLLREMETAARAGRLRYGLGLAAFPTPCGEAWGHTGNAQGAVTVAWGRKDASRLVVVAVNVYPLTGALESSVRRLQDAAFCGSA